MSLVRDRGNPLEVLASRSSGASLFLFFLAALFHVPVLWIGEDSVGAFDLLVVLFLFASAGFPLRLEIRLPAMEMRLVAVGALYVFYLVFSCFLEPTSYSMMLLVKNVEYLCILFIVLRLSAPERIGFEELSRIVYLGMLALSLFQLASFLKLPERLGFGPGFGYGEWYRIGMPFANGVSSNPAGFVQGAFFLIAFNQKKRSLGESLILGVCALAFLLTISRTNIIAVVLIQGFVYLADFAALRRNPLWIFLFAAVAVGGFLAFLAIIPRDSVLWVYFMSYTTNIGTILTDPSFTNRYAKHWPEAIALWLGTGFSFIFGRGLGHLRIVDGTVPRLLCNSGVIGLALFTLFWIVLPGVVFYGSRAIPILLAYVMVNSVNGETLIVSFRAVQAFIFLLVFASRSEESGWRGVLHGAI